MKWTKQAEDAVSRVPFFVRKRVKKRVEDEAARLGAQQVLLEHVLSCQKKFLNQMEEEIKGYQVETCFGSGGCPNRIADSTAMVQRLEQLLSEKDLKNFLKSRVKGPLKMHHEFRVSLSDCPNACSRPQIVDIGLIGAHRPLVARSNCTQCGACVAVCREHALLLPYQAEAPVLRADRCLSCGQCGKVCPSGSLREGTLGYRILIGGKLGRHPQLGKELKGIYSFEQVLEVVECCLEHYLQNNREGERFGEILNRTGFHPPQD